MRGSTPTTARATTRGAPARTPKTRTVKARPPPPAPRKKGGGSQSAGTKAAGGGGGSKASRSYINITGFPFPLGPFFERKTVVTELDKNSIWLFEQPQSLGLSNVTTNTRMTVIKLADGGLWVHAPIAPTRECVAALKALNAPVRHVVLPTFAYEHKVFMGPFCRAFPEAQAWVAPRQWSWPINLPVQFFGIFPTGVLTPDATPPWADEFEWKPFASSVGIGPYSEVAFFHKRSRTLLVTDAVVRVPRTPPPVVDDAALEEAGGPLPAAVAAFSAGPPGAPPPPPPPADAAARRALGWKRMALQILFFVPGDLGRPDGSFSGLADRLIVSPVLRKLVYGNAAAATRAWVDDVAASWDFRRIIPCHFEAPIAARPADWRAAFTFLEDGGLATEPAKPAGGLFGGLFGGGGGAAGRAVPFDPADMRALDGLAGSLKTTGVLNK